MAETNERDLKRVAVVAVHGVADQAPSTSARAAANLLLQVHEPAGRYSAFTEQSLRVAVRPVDVNQELLEQNPKPPGLLGKLDQRAASLRARHQGRDGAVSRAEKEAPVPRADDTDAAGHDFMRDQLGHYRIREEDTVYETLRLQGFRLGAGDKPECEVHIFEMYWADLSRLGSGVLRFFVELYLLMFFISQIGRKTLDFALARHRQWSWWWFSLAQAWAERCLTIGVPVLNLYLFALALTALPLCLPERTWSDELTNRGVLVLFFICLVGGFGVFLGLRPGWGRCWPWTLVGILVGAGGGLAVGLLCHQWMKSYLFLAGSWWLLGAAGVLVLMYFYGKRQRGALLFAVVAFVAISAYYVYDIATHPPITSDHDMVEASLRTAKGIVSAAAGVWMLFVGLAAVCRLLGWWAVCHTTGWEGRRLARRAAWTVNVSLVVPAVLILILNMSLWAALVRLAESVEAKLPERIRPLVASTHGLVGLNATNVFLLALVGIAAALLLSVWAFLPAVLNEIRTPRPSSEGDADRRLRWSRWLGNSLTAAFRALGIAGEILWWGLIVLFPLAAYVRFAPPRGWPEVPHYGHWLGEKGRAPEYALFALGAGIVAIVAAAGPLHWMGLGFRNALDVALDVANWLRLYPETNNPCSRISARYASLLRHICSRRLPGENRPAYDALVIFAHSLGSVITADLLRFLVRERASFADTDQRDKLLDRLGDRAPAPDSQGPEGMPVYLFTMGCPLRQLFSLRFPHQYGWVDFDKRLDQQPADIPPDQQPDPHPLGVVEWVNGYRSGDYVGRYVWRSEDCPYLWDTPAVESMDAADPASSIRREFCVGAGAHTHYWDGTAPDIGRELHRLIGQAASEPLKPKP